MLWNNNHHIHHIQGFQIFLLQFIIYSQLISINANFMSLLTCEMKKTYTCILNCGVDVIYFTTGGWSQWSKLIVNIKNVNWFIMLVFYLHHVVGELDIFISNHHNGFTLTFKKWLINIPMKKTLSSASN